MKHGSFIRLLACAGLAAATTAWAQLPATQLASIFPPGGKPGTSVEVTITGSDLDEVDQLTFSHGGITAAAKMTTPTELERTARPVPGQFTVTIAGNVSPGVYEATAVGRFGSSNPRSFVVGTLSELSDSAGNNSADKAIEVPLDSTVNGRVEQNNYDFFRLKLKQGERVVIDCAADRLDSRLDATLVVLNAAGREIARVRNTVGEDPVLDFAAPSEGDYTLKLHDAVYGGGAEYFYRLSVSSAPFVDFVFPPSGPAGSSNQYTLYGRNLPGGQPADGLTLAGAPLQSVQVSIPLPGDDAGKAQLAIGHLASPKRAWQDGILFRLPTAVGPANPVMVYLAHAPSVIAEQEPNDDATAATKVTVPCEVVGQFYPQRDVDWMQFDAKKGETYWIEAISSQLGLASDPLLVIFRVTKNDKGEEQLSEVAQADDPAEPRGRRGGGDGAIREFDAASDDPATEFKVPDDGTYRIFLRDQFGDGRKDPRYVYRLAIRIAEPDYRLLAFAAMPRGQQDDQNQARMAATSVRKGGTLPIAVAVQRRDGFEGEIAVSVEGLPSGVSCSGALLGGEVTRATLVIVAAESAAAWTGPIKIVGKAKLGEREVLREARYGVTVWGTQNRQQQLPEYRLAPTLQFGVIDKEAEPAFVQIGEDKVYETSLGGRIEIPITLTRRGDFKDSIKLTAVGLPNDIRPKEVTLDGNAKGGKLELQLNQQNTKPGTYTFVMRGDTKRKYVRNPEAVAAAEAEQKQIAEMQNQLSEALKAVTAAKDQAIKASQDAAAAAKAAEQKKAEASNRAKAQTDTAKQAAEKLAQAKEAAAKDTTNQGLADAAKAAETAASDAAAAQKKAEEELTAADKANADAQAASKTAEQARVVAESALKVAEDKVNQAKQLKQQLDKKVNDAKQANQPKDVTFSLVSTPIKLRISRAPFTLAPSLPGGPIKQGNKQELTVKLDRLYGFSEQVDLTFSPPQGVQGLSAQNSTLTKDQSEAKLEVVVADSALPGEHKATIRARGRFNNVQVETTTEVLVTVEAK
jgi:hypothetical protein